MLKKFGLLDIKKFSDCIDTGKYNQIVNENDSFARNMGLKSAPSFIFYNGTTPVAIQGAQPYEAFEKIITTISYISISMRHVDYVYLL